VVGDVRCAREALPVPVKFGEVAIDIVARRVFTAQHQSIASRLQMAFTSMNTQIRVPQPPPVPAAVVNPTVVTPAGPHPEEIDKAFASNHDLRKRVHAAIGMTVNTAVM
jgi:hypothetical protein